MTKSISIQFISSFLVLLTLNTASVIAFTSTPISSFATRNYDTTLKRNTFSFATTAASEHASSQPLSPSSLDNNNDRNDNNEIIKKKNILQERKRDWINRSLTYYSTVSREAKRRENGQYVPSKIELNQYKSSFITAKKLYFARHKVKKNQPRHAERIYRKLIDDLLREQEEEGSCDHAQIAISTLLLALLLQRQGEIKETRATFIRFFRLITMNGGEFKECTCSAKVLQAFALFEMKQKNARKAYALIQMAVKLDNELEPVLQWKQFRDARTLIDSGRRRRNNFDNMQLC